MVATAAGSLASQLVNLLAAVLLLLAFAMLAQRRVLSLIHLLAWQGAALAVSTLVVGYATGQTQLYFSAALTVVLKVVLIPWVLHRLIECVPSGEIGRLVSWREHLVRCGLRDGH